MHTKQWLLSTCAVLALLMALLTSHGQAAQVSLAWDGVADADGYKIYYGQASRSYQSVVDVRARTDYILDGLAGGQKYYFSATAYDAAGNESDYSNEVSTTTSPDAPPSTGLVAAYNFDEGSGMRVNDASGLGNHGTISGASWMNAGRYGKTLFFDGASAWVTIPAAASLDLTTGMTLEAWVYPGEKLTGWRAVLVKEGAGNASYYLYPSSSANRPVGGGLIGGAYEEVSGGASLAVRTWTHLATTYNGTTQRLFVNGVQVASRAQTGALQVTTGALRIGGDSIWGDYFKGRIDEVRVYKRALTAAEIQADMNTPVSSAATARMATAELSGVSTSGRSHPDGKTGPASALDKARRAGGKSLRSATSKNSANNLSPNTLSAASQVLNSELIEVGEIEVDANWKRIEFSKFFALPGLFILPWARGGSFLSLLLLATVAQLLFVNLKAYEERYYLFLVPLLGAGAGLCWERSVRYLRRPILRNVAAVFVTSTLLVGFVLTLRDVHRKGHDTAELSEVVPRASQLIASTGVTVARKPHLCFYLGTSCQYFPVVNDLDELRRALAVMATATTVPIYLHYGIHEQAMRPQFSQLRFPEGKTSWLEPVLQSQEPGRWVLYRFDPYISAE